MPEEDIMEFLKEYADALREGVDMSKLKSDQFPLSYNVSMAGGYIIISTANADHVATVAIDEGGGPSMPIGPVAMTFARLITNILNAYYEYSKNDQN